MIKTILWVLFWIFIAYIIIRAVIVDFIPWINDLSKNPIELNGPTMFFLGFWVVAGLIVFFVSGLFVESIGVRIFLSLLGGLALVLMCIRWFAGALLGRGRG